MPASTSVSSSSRRTVRASSPLPSTRIRVRSRSDQLLGGGDADVSRDQGVLDRSQVSLSRRSARQQCQQTATQTALRPGQALTQADQPGRGPFRLVECRYDLDRLLERGLEDVDVARWRS